MTGGQTRLGSLIEAAMNTGIGLVISVIANQLVFPRFGFHPTLGENVAISAIYTVISIVRTYCVRRWFETTLRRAAQRLARGAST